MEIYTKDLSEKVVVLNKSISLIVDYPTIEQKFKLDRAVAKGVTTKLPMKDGDVDWENITPEILTEAKAADLYRKRLFLKYTIKGWKGNIFKDNNEALIKDDELDDRQLSALCYDDTTVNHLYEAINHILEFTETDKKKSISTAGSKLKEA